MAKDMMEKIAAGTNSYAPQLPTTGEPVADLLLAIHEHQAADRQIYQNLFDKTFEENKVLRDRVDELEYQLGLFTQAASLQRKAIASVRGEWEEEL